MASQTTPSDSIDICKLMKNREKWRPSKFVYRKGRLAASRDWKEVGIGSRLITDLVAKLYDMNLKHYAKGKLLDLGCGDVPLYQAYKEYVTDIICVDWENSLHKNEYLDFECNLEKILPFEDGEFDTIILSDVLEHISEPAHLWKEMSRILAKNGMVIANVPFYYWLHEQPHDYYRYTEFALHRFVNNSGLTIIQLQPIGGSLEILADIISKNIQYIPIVGKVLAIIIQEFAWLFIKSIVGKRVSEQTRQLFPLGYFLIAEKA